MYKSRSQWRITPLVMVLAGLAGTAQAFELPVENEDFQLRWDNTLRYNYLHRVESQDDALLKAVNNDDGNRNFDEGTVSNRLDLLSEFDFVYRQQHGFRVSGAAWYDEAYDHLDNQSVATSNHMQNGQPAPGLSNFTDRYYRGPSGELLDAFAFTGFDLGATAVNARAGRHTVYWGESLLLGGALHGISYAQAPVDVAKGFAVPGAEAKELFRPQNQISLQLRPRTDLAVAAQYFLEWEPYRIPEAGSYLGFNDAILEGGEALIAAPGSRLIKGRSPRPDDEGDWGLALRWSPEALEGTLGLHYRKLSDKLPQVHLQPAVATMPAANCTALGFTAIAPTTCYVNPGAASLADVGAGRIGRYYTAFADDVDLYGISLSRNIGGISVGFELSYRENMPLVSDPVRILPAALAAATPGAVTALPVDGETGGARGDTLHGLVNLVGIVGGSPLWDSLTWATELTWNRWEKVTQNEAVFKGRDGYAAIDKVSRDFWGLALNVTPTWFQVFPSVDVLLPLSVSGGLDGNSAVILGGNEATGTYSVGVAADLRQRHRFDLKYVDSFGDVTTDASGAVVVANGNPALLTDRGFVSFTFKTAF
ncbi:MAG: DUF1302 domain-containing protein [Pseudomonadota bacterium]